MKLLALHSGQRFWRTLCTKQRSVFADWILPSFGHALKNKEISRTISFRIALLFLLEFHHKEYAQHGVITLSLQRAVFGFMFLHLSTSQDSAFTCYDFVVCYLEDNGLCPCFFVNLANNSHGYIGQ